MASKFRLGSQKNRVCQMCGSFTGPDSEDRILDSVCLRCEKRLAKKTNPTELKKAILAELEHKSCANPYDSSRPGPAFDVAAMAQQELGKAKERVSKGSGTASAAKSNKTRSSGSAAKRATGAPHAHDDDPLGVKWLDPSAREEVLRGQFLPPQRRSSRDSSAGPPGLEAAGSSSSTGKNKSSRRVSGSSSTINKLPRDDDDDHPFLDEYFRVCVAEMDAFSERKTKEVAESAGAENDLKKTLSEVCSGSPSSSSMLHRAVSSASAGGPSTSPSSSIGVSVNVTTQVLTEDGEENFYVLVDEEDQMNHVLASGAGGAGNAAADHYAKLEREAVNAAVNEKLVPIIKKSFAHHDVDRNGVLSKQESSRFFNHFAKDLRSLVLATMKQAVAEKLDKMVAQMHPDFSPQKKQDVANTGFQKLFWDMETCAEELYKENYLKEKKDRDLAAFAVVDTSGDGMLQEQEVVDCLKVGSKKNEELIEALGFGKNEIQKKLMPSLKKVLGEMKGKKSSTAEVHGVGAHKDVK
eukprot:g9774.t1